VTRALIFWCDGVLQRSRQDHRTPLTPDAIEVIGERAAHLRRFAADGWRLFGLNWLPEIAGRELSRDDATRVLARLRELLDVEIEFAYCPHAAGPPACWCRKPLPGLGVLLQHQYGLDPARCVYVGAGSQDPGFARRLGFQFRQAFELFGDVAAPPPV
jgi:hypothetical protein